MASRVRRGVIVNRATDYELLIATHGTRGQAEFFLNSRGQSLAEIEREHAAVQQALAAVMGRIPETWRRTSISRSELNRFLFEPDDVILAVGQDGLVANVAKYLSGQLVIGINPTPERFEGKLVRHVVGNVIDILTGIDTEHSLNIEERSMVSARLDDGQTLVALNEIFIGHRTHQSARYRIAIADAEERHSSSGLICCSGTGATGWACSIHRATSSALALPTPSEPSLCYFVREAWPSAFTRTRITSGRLTHNDHVRITSEMNQGGVIFGDGIEDDFLPFDWGKVATLGISDQRLRLVV